jgi:WD40 repeat protein
MPRVSPAAKRVELIVRARVELGEYVTALAVGADGLVVVGLGDGQLVGIELPKGRERFRVAAHPGGVLGLAVSPDGQRIATCGGEPTARLWSATGAAIAALPAGGRAWVEHVAWSPDGAHVAIAAGRAVRVWTATGAPRLESEALPSTVAGLAWRADSAGLAAIAYGGVHLLPLLEGGVARHLAWKGSLISVAWSPDGKILACGSQDASVHFWRLPAGKDSEMTGYPAKPKALAWDRESSLLATGGDAAVTVWDFRGKGPEGSRPIQLAAHEGLCTQLAFHPKKGQLASASADSSVLLWEPRRSNRPLCYGFLDGEATALAWHPDQSTLVGADARGTVCAWATP